MEREISFSKRTHARAELDFAQRTHFSAEYRATKLIRQNEPTRRRRLEEQRLRLLEA